MLASTLLSTGSVVDLLPTIFSYIVGHQQQETSEQFVVSGLVTRQQYNEHWKRCYEELLATNETLSKFFTPTILTSESDYGWAYCVLCAVCKPTTTNDKKCVGDESDWFYGFARCLWVQDMRPCSDCVLTVNFNPLGIRGKNCEEIKRLLSILSFMHYHQILGFGEVAANACRYLRNLFEQTDMMPCVAPTISGDPSKHQIYSTDPFVKFIMLLISL